MATKRRVYISAPYLSVLSEQHGVLKAAILKYLEANGFEPQHFLESGIPAGWGWNFAAANDVMRRCHGAVILALPRWRLSDGAEEVVMPTEYNHFEGALASAHSLPLLILADREVIDRGIVWTGGGVPVHPAKRRARVAREFNVHPSLRDLEARRHGTKGRLPWLLQ